MGKFFSYEKRRALEEQYKRSIKKVKVDKKSAIKIFNLILKQSDGILAGNMTYNQGVRARELISYLEDHIKFT